MSFVSCVGVCVRKVTTLLFWLRLAWLFVFVVGVFCPVRLLSEGIVMVNGHAANWGASEGEFASLLSMLQSLSRPFVFFRFFL